MIAACVMLAGTPSGQSGGGGGQGAPVADFSWFPKPVFQGSVVSFTNTSTGATPMTFIWSINGSVVSTNRDFSYYPSANFLCELEADNPYGASYDYQYITVNTNH